jgi:predicted PurR-regulated permease PerM
MQQILNQFFYLFFIIIAIALLYLLAPILTPFVLGALLAYLIDPLVIKLKRLHIPNLLSVLLVFLFAFSILGLLIVLLVPLIEKQVNNFIVIIPQMIIWLQNKLLPWLNDHFGVQELVGIDTIKSAMAGSGIKVGGMLTWTFKTVVHSGHTLILWLTNLVLIPVVTFYLLRDWDRIIKGIRNSLPRSIEPIVVKMTHECNEVLSAFFRGQLLVMLSLSCIYSIGLTLVGIKIGLVIGIIAGIFAIVPYLGFIIGITMASIAAVLQFGAWDHVFLVWAVFLVGQCTESFFLTPLLVGHRIGLHPVAVIFSVLTGGMLFGFFGILLALPVASVVMVWIRYFNQRYRASGFYK